MSVEDRKNRHTLFYSSIIFATNAAKIAKVINSNPKNKLSNPLSNCTITTMYINAYKIWDKSQYNIEKYLNETKKYQEKDELISNLRVIIDKHQQTLKNIKDWRHLVIAHIGNNLSLATFHSLRGDVNSVLLMLEDVSEIVRNTTIFKEENAIMSFLDYSDVQNLLFDIE